VIKHLHYRSDVDALVVLADSDDAPLEKADETSKLGGRPRLDDLRECVVTTKAGLRGERPGPLRVAVALAVPALEAWLLHGSYKDVGEAAWFQARSEGRRPYTRAELKQRTYGSQRPGVHDARRIGVEAARSVATRIDTLSQFFPRGFGRFAEEVRSWRS
jgi:hypothetical protein